MSNALAKHYLEWLEPQIVPDGVHIYWNLLDILQDKEFVWLVPNDDNRIGDAISLRMQFLHEVNRPMPDLAPSVLEVLIAFSQRMEFQTGEEARIWAWRFIMNLDLHNYSDPIMPRKYQKIDAILDTFIWRTYERDGSGGLFPVAFHTEDQRKIELWYQAAAYLAETFEF